MIRSNSLVTFAIVLIIIGTLLTTLVPYSLYFYYLPVILLFCGLLIVWLSVRSIRFKFLSLIFPLLFYFSFQYIWIYINTVEPKTFLITNDYRGKVRIFFNEKCGDEKTYENDRRLYNIPKDGILFTQFSDEQGIVNYKFYIVEGGKRKKVEQQMVQDFNEEWTTVKNPNEPKRDKLSVFHAGRTYSDGSMEFYVCTYDELKMYDFKYDKKFDSLINAKQKKLSRYCR